MGIIKRYFEWLQYKTPASEVEKYPYKSDSDESSVKGVFIIGDLTGIPLLKFAAESGKKIIDRFEAETEFQSERKINTDKNIYDLIIVGAGPAGISAGIEAYKKGYNFLILESSDRFSTIHNFPKGKPIYAEPSGLQQESEIKINDGTKESLIGELNLQTADFSLPVKEGTMVEKISRNNGHLVVETQAEKYETLRIVLAIGKSGNTRKLNVPGEEKEKVFNRMFDPADTKNQDVLVVGGGDSALETAIAAAGFAKSVTLSYRKKEFSRPKEGNFEKLTKLQNEGKINVELNSEILQINDNSVLLKTSQGEKKIPNLIVYTMIGRELPLDFLKRSGIRMEGELSFFSKLQFILLILISGVLYFGKSSADLYTKFTGIKTDSLSDLFSSAFSGKFIYGFIKIPGLLFTTIFSDSVKIWNVTKYINAGIAYVCFIGAVILGIYVLFRFIRRYYSIFGKNWLTIKYLYFIATGAFFCFTYFSGRYFGYQVLGKSQAFWYTGLYSLTILIFGLRRIKMKPTKYIKYQTWSLILIQAFPLFILPEFIFPYLGNAGLLGAKDGFVMSQIFPGGSYWRSYGFILAWPLNFSNLFNGGITAFWLIFSLIQTFIIIPLIVYKWGKGAYCGWVCSCGALAETLGDEYRTLAPHGSKAKKLENTGQWILAAAFVITALKLVSILYDISIPVINENISYASDFLHKFYYVGVDVIFAGVLGVGVYFFLSGRVWCRFGCPLAALMHIYTRFSKYRIFSDKKKCISCNICTKVCHMGIDVMNYANKGIPMNDAECVRCSACIVNCPTEVLSFGETYKADIYNKYGNEKAKIFGKSSWKSGL